MGPSTKSITISILVLMGKKVGKKGVESMHMLLGGIPVDLAKLLDYPTYNYPVHQILGLLSDHRNKRLHMST